MLAILLLALFSLILALIASVSLRNGFFVFLILYGVYPRFLAVGIGEGGFAITGPRVFILILALTFLGRFILNDKLVTRGLNKCRTEWLLLTMLGILVVAKVCGSIIWGRFDVGSLGAFGSDVLWYPFGVVLALTVLRKEQDFFLVFVCLGFSILLNSIAVALEVIRDQSIFSGNIEVQYETFSDFNVLEGKTRDGSYRAMGTTPNPLVLARMVCFALPGLLVLLLSRVNFEFRIIGLLGLVASLPIVLLTQARAATAVVVLTLLYAAYLFFTVSLQKNLRILIALIGLGAVIIIGGQFINDIVGLVFEGGSYQTLRSSQSRAMQYISTIPLVLTSPLFGFGYARNYDLLLSVGNIDGHFLYLALQGGIVATLAMLLALARGIWIAGRAKSEAQSPQAKSIAWAIRITLVMMVALMLVYSMHNSHFYVALFLGAAIAIDRIRVSR